MDAVISSFIAGMPFLLLHFGVTMAMLIIACGIYMWITPHDEMALIRDGNEAAAISLAGAILGLALPLAVCMATSVNVLDIVIWGVLTLVIQIVAFRVIDFWLKDLPGRIVDGQKSAAILLAAVKLGVGMVNAAAVSG